MKIFYILFPSLLFLIFCLAPSWAILFLYERQIKRKKSPLNIELLRSPGESLKKDIEDINQEISINIIIIPTIPIILYSVLIAQLQLNNSEISNTVLGVYILGVLLNTFYFSRKLLKLLKSRNSKRVGYECELAVGQDLNQLLPLGFKVFHDFPARKFNIDHIAVGPTGVFAIETKGRARIKKQENENWKVEFDGEKLNFPGWVETKPIAQAKRQAKWLQKWISEATGENIPVTPVLAIPGWFITRKISSNLKIYNGKHSSFLAKSSPSITSKQIQVISFQIEQKCRDIKAMSYKITAQQ